MNDYDFQKMASDYAQLTWPGSPSHALPKKPRPMPATKFRPRSAWSTPWAYAATARHAAQDGAKPRAWCSLPRLENGYYKPCTALAIAELCAVYAVTALESLRKTII